MATKSIFGLYLTRSDVEAAVRSLKNAGFASSDISVLLPEGVGGKEAAAQRTTKAPEGATAGAGSGAAVGGAIGWLAGVGALIIPGLGPFLAAGPLVATLVGIGVGGTLGGFVGGLVGLGIPEEEARLFEGRLLKGGMLIAVHCEPSQQADRAKSVMEATGAEDISVTAEAWAGIKHTAA
jgi:hypothetical protein